MEIIKNVTNDALEISDKLEDAFAPVYPGISLVFVEQYKKNNNGEIVPEVIGGIVKTPLTLNTTYLNNNRNVCFEFSQKEAYHRIGSEQFKKKNLRAFIPVNSELVDMEEMRRINEDSSITYKPEIPSGENVVKLYVGTSAFNYLSKLINRK